MDIYRESFTKAELERKFLGLSVSRSPVWSSSLSLNLTTSSIGSRTFVTRSGPTKSKTSKVCGTDFNHSTNSDESIRASGKILRENGINDEIQGTNFGKTVREERNPTIFISKSFNSEDGTVAISSPLSDKGQSPRGELSKLSGSTPIPKETRSDNLSLAIQHFPITLGSQLNQFRTGADVVCSLNSSVDSSNMGSFDTSESRTTPRDKNKRSRPREGRRRSSRRSSSGRSSSSSTSGVWLGQLYLNGIESASPPAQGTQTLFTTNPFQAELVRLQIDRLRREEEGLLLEKLRLQNEIRRPPMDKWYELKSSQFHNEFHKHNSQRKSIQSSEETKSLKSVMLLAAS